MRQSMKTVVRVLSRGVQNSGASARKAAHVGGVIPPLGDGMKRVSPVRICTRKIGAEGCARMRARKGGVVW